jgi:hypothetical protein
MRRITIVSVLLMAAVASGTSAVGGAASATPARGADDLISDFNCDGFTDLAIAAYHDDLGAFEDAGGVNVIYGSPTGLRAAGNQFWTQDSPDIEDQSESNDQFGRNLGTGDFNGDGCWDLVVGVQAEDVNGVFDAGAVNVIYGSPSGLTSVGNQFWSQDSPGILDDPEQGDAFGWNSGFGDFNDDGYDELLVGAQTEDVDGAQNAGAMHVIYGSATGLTSDGNQFLHQNSPGMAGDGAEIQDVFARAFANGDFNGDGIDDVAVGIQTEDIGPIVDAGAANVLYGSTLGLTTDGSQFWHQDSPGILDEAEEEDWFGRTGLGAGDIDADGFDDLVVGVLLEDVGSVPDAGAINVIFGSPAGLVSDGNEFWSQDSPGVKDVAESHDIFSRYLDTGDFNGDGFEDVVVGVEDEGGPATVANGMVNVLYATSDGLSALNNQVWHQDSRGIKDVAEDQDRYGRVVAAGDFNGDGYMDFAMGGGGEDIGPIGSAGAVAILYGTPTGITSTWNQFWHQDSPGILDQAEAGDHFGRWLTPQG